MVRSPHSSETIRALIPAASSSSCSVCSATRSNLRVTSRSFRFVIAENSVSVLTNARTDSIARVAMATIVSSSIEKSPHLLHDDSSCLGRRNQLAVYGQLRVFGRFVCYVHSRHGCLPRVRFLINAWWCELCHPMCLALKARVKRTADINFGEAGYEPTSEIAIAFSVCRRVNDNVHPALGKYLCRVREKRVDDIAFLF